MLTAIFVVISRSFIVQFVVFVVYVTLKKVYIILKIKKDLENQGSP